MLTLTRISVLALATISAVLAQDVETDDIPQRCRNVCASVVSLSQGCDTNDNDDTARLNCICTNPSASTEIPLCNACLTEVENDPDNNVADIARSCSFASTTFASSLTSATSGATSSPATNAASLTSSISSAAASATSAAQSTLSSVASSASSAASSAVNSASDATSSATAGTLSSVTNAAGSVVSSATQAAASQTGNAGAVVTAMPLLGAGVGVVAAVLGMM
ncbi:hypothetical protein B0A48_10221 [Cryoendolithus antarcticus]|uniref:CFEM domain-containing protein n=1 Tax=Cryoendolithus antarcticus TaxID=1507870 RepID=A0A1V8SWK4_9PEZI|nr:hypothetical protein B0A48_10221 [Cryoendolithus antarcticus]